MEPKLTRRGNRNESSDEGMRSLSFFWIRRFPVPIKHSYLDVRKFLKNLQNHYIDRPSFITICIHIPQLEPCSLTNPMFS